MKTPVMKRGPLVIIVTAAIALTVDQLTKELVRHYIELGDPPDHAFIRFVHVANDGIIFGIPAPLWAAIILSILIVAGVLVAYYRYGFLKGRATNAGLGLFVGGTIGNLLDRLRFGWVTDFVDVRIKSDVPWFTFNLADVAILAAIIIFVFTIFGHHPARTAKSS